VPNDLELAELAKRIAGLHEEQVRLAAEHNHLHKELVAIFERIKQIHDIAPILGPDPPNPPSLRRG
jgi:hypothetical protein